jgi:hypothetical protein
MSAHTPGPWKVISEAAAREVEVFEIAEVSHFRVICDGRGDGFASAGDAFADASLIAEAPTLLAAARRAVLALAWAAERNPIFAQDYEAVSDAIARATKESL